jgi:hypothetical protein
LSAVSSVAWRAHGKAFTRATRRSQLVSARPSPALLGRTPLVRNEGEKLRRFINEHGIA